MIHFRTGRMLPVVSPLRLLLLGFLLARSAWALDLQARIEHVATDVVFINLGSQAGLRTGDLGRVMLAGQPAVELEVVHVSSKRASLRLPEGLVGLAIGETVLFTVPDDRLAAAPAPAPAVVDTLDAQPVRKRRNTEDRRRALKGFVSVEQFQETGARERWDRSLRGSLRSESLAGLPIGFRSRFRLRQEHPAAGAERWTSRVPLLEFQWQPRATDWELRMGRLAGAGLGRAGSLDGLEVVRDAGSMGHWHGWAGVGTDPGNDRPDANLQKAGLGWSATRAALGGQVESGLALAGSYSGGEAEREFVAQRLSGTFPLAPGTLSLGQESELDINRGWRAEKQNSLALNRFDLRARQAVGPRWQFSAGWRFQRSPLTLEQKNLADSLLALHESGSFNLGADWKPQRVLSLSAEASLLRDRAGLTEGRSLRFGLRHSALPLDLSGGLGLRLYHNSAGDTRALQGDLARAFGRSTRLVLRAGVQSVDTTTGSGQSRWAGLALDQGLWRGAFLRAEGEQETSDTSDAQQRASLELGWRF